MPSADLTVRVYQDLAKWYENKGDAQMRDRFLVLAADAMWRAGQAGEAERVREHLLTINPHHLLKPFASLGEALKAADVQNYLDGLRRTYPRERAYHLLESLQSGKGENASGGVPDLAHGSPVPERDAGSVYRMQEGAPKPPTPTAPPPLGRPVRGLPARNNKTPALRPARALAAPVIGPRERDGFLEADRLESATGSFFSFALFWILLILGVAFAGFIFAQPFLER
jgi:hypothetical protein